MDRIKQMEDTLTKAERLAILRQDLTAGQRRSVAVALSIVAAVLLGAWLALPRSATVILGGLIALAIFNAYESYELRRRLERIIDVVGQPEN